MQSKKSIAGYFESHDIKSHGIFEKKCILFSNKMHSVVQELKKWMDDRIIYSEEVSISDSKAEYLIKQLFKAFYVHPKQLPDYVLEKYFRVKKGALNRADLDEEALRADDIFIRMIADHIGGMTDQFASRTYKKLYYPDYI